MVAASEQAPVGAFKPAADASKVYAPVVPAVAGESFRREEQKP